MSPAPRLSSSNGYHRLLAEAGFADVAVHPETVPITTAPLGILPKLAADATVEPLSRR
jgi:hypothetical protein